MGLIGNPPQDSCLENPMDGQRSLVGYSPWGNKELDTTEWFHFSFCKDELIPFVQIPCPLPHTQEQKLNSCKAENFNIKQVKISNAPIPDENKHKSPGKFTVNKILNNFNIGLMKNSQESWKIWGKSAETTSNKNTGLLEL